MNFMPKFCFNIAEHNDNGKAYKVCEIYKRVDGSFVIAWHSLKIDCIES